MKNKLRILVDNRAEEPLKKEHGFSILLEWQGKRVLFDTAQEDSLFHNAKVLGISLDNLDALVLSHGHYDHGGNLKEILDSNPDIPVYCHPSCFTERYSLRSSGEVISVALSDRDRNALLNLPGKNLQKWESLVEVVPGFYFSGAIPRYYPDEDTGGPFYLEKDLLHPDPLNDDISIWLDHGKDISIICGCCHSGIRNTVDHIRKQAGKKGIRILLGGFHLLHAGEKRLNDTIDYLNSSPVESVYPAHCTGPAVIDRFEKELVCQVIPSYAGLQVSLD